MNRTYLMAFACLGVFGVLLAVSLPGVSQAPTPIPSVWLQPYAPGIQQTGYIRIKGRYLADATEDNAVAMSLSIAGNNSGGLTASATGTNAWGVRATGTTYGVVGHGDNAGVFGNSYVDTGVLAGGPNYGVRALATTASGIGVYGQNDVGIGVKGTGVVGMRGEGSSSDGVYGTTGSASAAGVSGVNTANGLGVNASSTGGYGVQGTGGGFAGVYGTGATNGLYGLTANNGASGVYGVNSGTGWGVYGAASTSGTAVAGVNPNPAGYGMYSSGRLTATGTKQFQIDYPFDPENKYLNHFCTEGAEPMNAYSGSVITDEKGYATVMLPEYFAEINKDPRIQLTTVDGSDDFVMAKVVDEVTGNAFTLRTSKPRTKVFWRVEAIRNDNWVKRNGFADIEDKPARLRGTYLNPEFFSQPAEKGQFYVQPQRPLGASTWRARRTGKNG